MTAPILTGLYVPGDKPDWFDKAATSGAQMVILDLEDAVAPERKAIAREAVAAWLEKRVVTTGPLLQVRITADPRDLAALGGIPAAVEFRVPKVESPEQLDAVVAARPGHPVTALLESAMGVEGAGAIARHPAVTRLALGESDLASDLGTAAASAIDYARIRVLFAARAAGLPAPMLSAYPGIRDLDGLRADTIRGRDLGWVGRTAIHPSQLDVIAAVFRPDDAAIAWAREVLTATVAGGVSTLANGDMVDRAMIGRARGILSLAGAKPE